MMFETNLNVQNGVFGLFTKLPSLQFFAAGENNDLPVKVYQKDYKELLPAVFGSKSYLRNLWVGGQPEIFDGVAQSATMFSVKTSDIDLVIADSYDKDPNVAFGSGTGNSNRFGQRKEIIYTDMDVPYDSEWSLHEGFDRATVNANLDDAVLDRLELFARKESRKFDNYAARKIVDMAKNMMVLYELNNDTITELFNRLNRQFVNYEIEGDRYFACGPVLYNLIVNHPLSTTSKNSQTNIDNNEVVKFKGFFIQEAPDSVINKPTDDNSQTQSIGLVYVSNVAKLGVGINTLRTVESEQFDGKALQGHGKFGSYFPEDNKKALVVILDSDPGPQNMQRVSDQIGNNPNQQPVDPVEPMPAP